MLRRQSYRPTARSVLRRTPRGLNRSSLRGRRRGPDDFAQMLTAYGRAIRAHRRLARLAPQFFDAAVVARERENRAEQRRWLALWEPLLAKAYDVAPEPTDDRVKGPPLPPPRTQSAVDRQLAELSLWLAAAHAARKRHRQRHPHAQPTLCRLARLLQLAFDLKKMVLGLDSQNPLPEKITYDYEFTDCKRAYGHLCDDRVAGAVPSNPPVAAPAAGSGPVSATPPAGGVPCPSPVAEIQPSADPPRTASPRCDAWSRWARQLRRRRG